jgi:hypothetical protein
MPCGWCKPIPHAGSTAAGVFPDSTGKLAMEHSVSAILWRHLLCDISAIRRSVTFQEELIAFLKKNGIAYDERYIWS